MKEINEIISDSSTEELEKLEVKLILWIKDSSKTDSRFMVRNRALQDIVRELVRRGDITIEAAKSKRLIEWARDPLVESVRETLF